MSETFFRSVGGIPIVQGNDVVWNFGIASPPEGITVVESKPDIYTRFPNLVGAWDGRTSVNHHNAARLALGSDLPAHAQKLGTCFPAGTPVLMADRSERPIESVQVDKVVTHTGKVRKVLRTMRRLYEGRMVTINFRGSLRPVRMTDDHPVYVTDDATGKAGRWKWIAARDVRVADYILHIPSCDNPDAFYSDENLLYRPDISAVPVLVGAVAPVISVESEAVSRLEVFNLEVEEEHSYVAGGIAVHNCGGHAGSRGLELVQVVAIAKGIRARFKPVSHAWLYYLARRKYRMLGGGDGVAGGSIPEVMAETGVCHREEAGDPSWDGPSVDTIAGQWGAGRIDAATVQRLTELAKDNIVTEWVRVRSAQELADGIAAGGIGIGSDMQGFTMTRDAEGFCRPSGTWAHYHVRSGVRVTARGRKGFDYNQSWGRNTPSGPLLEGCPDNCFGVDWDVQDGLCRRGEWHVVFGLPPFELEQGNVDIPWRF